jgi:hypothetical protein
MSSVQGRPGTPVERLDPAEPLDDARPVCPECQQRYSRSHPGQLFCTPRHRDRWNNRAAVRGRVLTPLQMVARITRNGTRGSPADRKAGRLASSQLAYLINRYRDEDAAAQRMPWPAYLTLRYASGFDPL